MIKNLLCSLGIHSWGVWSVPFVGKSWDWELDENDSMKRKYYDCHQQSRICKNCDKIVTREL